MTIRVLTGVRRTGEEGEGDEGAGDASMGESGWWDMRGAVTALRLGTVQLCHVSRDFPTRATRGYFEASFASAQPGPRETADSGVSTGPARGVL
jgi:hypothetical protein